MFARRLCARMAITNKLLSITQILYRLLLRRGCFQAAADSMYEFAARLQSELRADIAVLRLAEDSLQLALGALRMVDRRHPNTVVESGTNEKALEQELARIGARIAGVLSGLDVLQLNDAELVEVLVEAGKHRCLKS